MERDNLKRRVASKPPMEVPEVSQRVKREQRIRLLKQSLPQQTELAHIFATDPEEADKLATYCRQIVGRIADLEAEHKTQLKLEDQERHGKVRDRAKQRSEAKRAATVQGWLNKEFSAEDRAGHLSESRGRNRSEKRDRTTEQVQQRKAQRLKYEEDKTLDVVRSIRAWENNVESIEERHKEARRKWQYESHSRTLAFDKVQANLVEQERQRMNKMREDAGEINYDVELHSWRARLAIQEKQRRAHEAASKTVPKAQVDHALDKKRWDELRRKEERHAKNLESVAEEREKEQEERQAKHKALMERAQKRIAEHEKEEKLKMQQLAAKIRQRDELIDWKNAERSKQTKNTAGVRRAKLKAFQENSSRQVGMRNAQLAQKWADRAVRIGEDAGVPAGERPDLIRQHADALEASKQSSILAIANQTSGCSGSPSPSASTPCISATIKASPEHPAWLSLLVPRSAKRSKPTRTKQLTQQQPKSAVDESKSKAVLRLQCLRRQQGAKKEVEELRASPSATTGQQKEEHIIELQRSMRRKQANDDVADRRSRSASPSGKTHGNIKNSRASKEDQEHAVRLIQSSERRKDAAASIEIHRARSRERKDQPAASGDGSTPNPLDEAARTMQSAGRNRSAKAEVASRRAASRERNTQQSPSIVS